jgi:hypothetical protein
VRGFGQGVTLEGLRLDGGAPLAVWSILKPRDSVREDDGGTPVGQPCVCVDYLLAGVVPDVLGGVGLAEGLWTLELPDHALGRVLERLPTPVPLEAVVAEAHHNLLQLRTEVVMPEHNLDRAPQFLLRAGPGGFICELRAGFDVSAGNAPLVHAQAVTWIADDMVRDDQVLLVPDGTPGTRLIDGWLLPMPVRRIVPSGNQIVLRTSQATGRHSARQSRSASRPV